VVVIPAGSQVVGQLRPTNDGSRFVSSELVSSNADPNQCFFRCDYDQAQRARSRLQGNPSGCRFGIGAAAGIGEAIDEVDTSRVLAGAGVGAAVGANKNRNITSVPRDAPGRYRGRGLCGNRNDIKAENVLGGAARHHHWWGCRSWENRGKSSLLIQTLI